MVYDLEMVLVPSREVLDIASSDQYQNAVPSPLRAISTAQDVLSCLLLRHGIRLPTVSGHASALYAWWDAKQAPSTLSRIRSAEQMC